MDQVLFALPILPGKTVAARAFLAELGGPSKPELAECGRNMGVTKETWAIQSTPQGDLLVVYMAGEVLAKAFAGFAASQDAFDRWQTTGLGRRPGRTWTRRRPDRSARSWRTPAPDPTRRRPGLTTAPVGTTNAT